MILEDSTKNLRLVDWDEADWYPRYFEHAGMRNLIVHEHWGRFDQLR
jgi:hypothetical protein